MGRGRSFAGHKIVPPKGARWAPKPNARARGMRRELTGKGGGYAVFEAASNACKIKGS